VLHQAINMSNTQATVILAFDFGLSHIGVAVGQSITATASPLTTLKADRGTPEWAALGRLISEWKPHRLIVGLPLNMDDSESEMSARARKFANRLEGRFGVQTCLVDERLTTFEAQLEDALDPHSGAACLIAQSWLAGSG